MNRRRFLATLFGTAGAFRRAEAARTPRTSGATELSQHTSTRALANPATAAAFFSDAQRAALDALADQVLPGSAALGIVDYLEQLATAFDYTPPRIYAGGPFSGRRPISRGGVASAERPRASFADWLPLDRVQERAWRLRLYGSAQVQHSNQSVTGDVIGLRPLLSDGATHAAGLLAGGAGVEAAWDAASDEFRARFRELVVEACFGDPVYGGNRDEKGWAAIDFPGDSLPLGYTPFDSARGEYREREDAPATRWPSDEGRDPLGFGARLLVRLMGLGTRLFED
jgi:gluconate 2-dehydrogenase gamma chain